MRYSSYLGKTLNNRYEVKSLLGEGGMGQVFLAWDKQSRNECAIKIVDTRKKKYPLESVIRFQQEASTLKSLNHPGIVKYFDFFGSDEVYALSMEHISGQTLLQLIEENSPVPILQMYMIFRRLVEALVYIHEKGLVHHDFKSSNILIDNTTKENWNTKILDFGFSQLVGNSERPQGGTLVYMAPEQTGMLHKSVDHRADLYSLGIIGYELATGRVPFQSEDPAVLLHLHVAQKPKPPSEWREDIPPVFEAILLKLLNKDPEDRYRTTVGLLKDLDKIYRYKRENKSALNDIVLGEEDHWDSFPRTNPFVDRNIALKKIKEFYQETLRLTQGKFVFVEGEKGIGKTVFINHFYNESQKNAEFCWHLQIRKEEIEVPLKSIKNILVFFVNFLRTLPEPEQYFIIQYFQKTFNTKFHLFLELAPDLKSWLSNTPVSPTTIGIGIQDYTDYHQVTLEFLKRVIQKQKKILIFFDDIQNLDQISLQFFISQAQELAKLPFMVIFTYNYAEMKQEHRGLLKILQALPMSRLITLEQLSQSDYGELLHFLFSRKMYDSSRLIEPLYAATQGNPSTLRSFLQKMIDHKLIYYENRIWNIKLAEALAFIKEMSSNNLAQNPLLDWSDQEQSVLQRGAGFQRAFLMRALQAVLLAEPAIDLTEAEIIAILDKAQYQGILAVDSNRLYFFRDPTLKLSLAQTIPAGLKQKIHQCIAVFLEAEILPQNPDSILDIAHHWSKTGNLHQTLEYYCRAAEYNKTSLMANRQSYVYYSLALEILKQLPPAEVPAKRQFIVRSKAIEYGLIFTRQYDSLWQDLLALEPYVGTEKHQMMLFYQLKGELCFARGDKETFFNIGQLALDMATESADEFYISRTINLLGKVPGRHSFRERSDLLSRGIELSLKFGIYDEAISSLSVNSVLLAYQGRFAEAKDNIYRIFEHLKTVNFPNANISRDMSLMLLEEERGDFNEVVVRAELMDKHRDEFPMQINLFYIARYAFALGMTGKVAQSLDLYAMLLDKQESSQQQMERTNALFGRIVIALKNVDSEMALYYLDQADQHIKIRTDAYMEIQFQLQRAHANIQLNQLEVARQIMSDDLASRLAKLESPLLICHHQFLLSKLNWLLSKDKKWLNEGKKILQNLLQMEVTGWYETYKDDLNNWSKLTSDSSSQTASAFEGNREILQLLEINRKITSTLDTDLLFKAVLEGAMMISGAEAAYLFICEKGQHESTTEDILSFLKITRDSFGNSIPQEQHNYSKNILKIVSQSKTAVLTRDARNEKRWELSHSIHFHKLRSILAVPILLQDEIQGILYLDNHQATAVFGLKDREIVEVFATQVAIALNNARAYLSELSARKQTEATLKVFERFVPRQFTETIAKGGIESLETGLFQKANLTVLFSDIRGFTSITEILSVQEIFQFLNHYLHLMEESINRHHGFVDKFIGDAIMALFDRNPEDALQAALDMLASLKLYNIQRRVDGLHPLRIGIGLNTGEVMIGVIGSQRRMDTTVLGDTVNLASRIESLTKYYESSLLLGENTYELVKHKKDIHMRLLDKVQVKGKAKASCIYEVFQYDETEMVQKKVKFAEEYQKAFELYQQGSWMSALNIYQRIREQFPQDPLSLIFMQRCQIFHQTPPKNWDGVYTLGEK